MVHKMTWNKQIVNELCYVGAFMMTRLNPGIFRIFELSKEKMNLSSSDCRTSKTISNDTKPEPISWEPNIEN